MKRVLKICTAVFFIFAFQIPFAAQSGVQKSKPAEISDFLYAAFLNEGFEPERHYLQNTMSQDFPYNVLVSAGKKAAGNNDRKKLIICCPQRDIAGILPEMTNLIRRLREKERNFETSFVFTANDYSPSGTFFSELQASAFVNSGIHSYINNLETNENTAAFIIRRGSNEHVFPSFRKKHIEIIPGARNEYNRGTVVPRDFLKMFTKACSFAGVSYAVRDRFLSLYRIGFSENEALVSAFFSADIPALMLILSEENTDALCSVLEHCAEEYNGVQSFTGDRRYSFFTLFSQSLFISEYAYVLFLSAAAAVTLFLFFIFSFIRGAHRYIHREEFFKTWYLIPLTLCVTAVLLHAGQFAAVKTAASIIKSPLFFLTVKTAFTLALFTFLFFPLAYYTLKLPLTGFIYGYLLSVSAFLNIFVFAAVDVTLVPLFILEYALIYISRSMRRLFPLIVCSLCMLIPYIPFIRVIAGLDTELCVHFISEAPFIFNLLYAAVLLPFEIMVIRILIRFKTWKRRASESKKRIRLQAAFAVSSIALFFFSCFTLSAVMSSVQSAAKPRLAENKQSSVSLAFDRTAQFGRSLFTLKLSCKQPVVRYYIEISSSSVLPVFEANYPYDMFVKPAAAVFALDDYPPNPFVLTFSAEGIQNTLCRVTALVETDEGIQTETLSYTIAGAH